MSYEIKTHGRIGPALQDLVQAEIARTIQSLREVQSDPQADATHDVRKRLKKMRALLTLLRAPLGKKPHREADSALQKSGRTLSALRDAQALRKTLEQLQRRFFPGKPPALIRAIREALTAHEGQCSAQLNRSRALSGHIASLETILAQVPTWPVEDYGWKELRRAVKHSYERARESYQKAHDAPTAERLHRWRKQVKELCFHVRLLRRVCPALMEELAQDFEVLGEFLGDDHDLVVLRAALEERQEKLQHGPAMETLLELLDLRREELLDAAFDLGERLHEDAPTVFARELDQRRATRQQRRAKAKKLRAQFTIAA